MPKYQIILSSDEILTDQEFEKLLDDSIQCPLHMNSKFKLVYAQNLEGIRKELWEKKEQLKESVYQKQPVAGSTNPLIDTTFDEIKDLFKLD